MMNDSRYQTCLEIYDFLKREMPHELHDQGETKEYHTTPTPELAYNASVNVNDSVGDVINQISCSMGNCPVEIYKRYVRSIIIPIFCTVGIFGNLINIFVLTRKKFQTSLDSRNKSCATLGLVSLAISDMLYCILALPEAFMDGERILFRQKDFLFYYQNYGSEIKTFFYYLSTWLTVMMAVSRYCAICKLQQSRYWRETKYFIIVLVTLIIIWILLLLPTFWKYQVNFIQCPTHKFSVYFIKAGPFITNRKLREAFSNIYTFVGYVIPMVILSYCNFHLIKTLRESVRTRHVYRVHERNNRNCNKITPTLIAVIFMFLFLCSPAEVLSFCFYHVSAEMAEKFTFLLVTANMLQMINFSMNFLLYCLVNSHFRSTLKHVITCGRRGLLMRNASFSSRYSSKRLSQPTYPLSNLNFSTIVQQQK